MSDHNSLFFGNSVSAQLLKSIFRIYLVIAILVTVIQIYYEYKGTKNDFLVEIEELHKSLKNPLADAVYTYHEAGIDAILTGILNNSVIEGISLIEPNGKFIYKKGNVGIGNDHIEGRFLDGLFFQEYPIILSKVPQKKLGNIRLYSHEERIIDRIKYGFILILINSFIKTILLWLVMVYFIRKILSKPILEFSKQVKLINLAELKNVDLNYKYKNEFSFLRDSFNDLINDLSNAYSKIKDYQLDLEDKVEQRTNKLKHTQKKLIDIAHQEGKAEMAIGILHNIGNSLTNCSVIVENCSNNLENSIIMKQVREIHKLLKENENDLNRFFNKDEKGKTLPSYLIKFLPLLVEEKNLLSDDMKKVNAALYFVNNVIKEQKNTAKIKNIWKRVKVHDFIANGILLYEDRLKIAKIKLEMEVDPEFELDLLEEKAIQVFHNLIENSIDSLIRTSNNSIKNIRVYGIINNNSFDIGVEDNGPGVKEIDNSNIFNFGFTTKINGNGFGLHSSYFLMQEMGGELLFESLESGVGVVFIMRFPII